MHKPNEAGHGPEHLDAAAGYEATDVKVTGIVVFLAAMAIFGAVTAFVAYGVGKGVNWWNTKEDGPNNHWAHPVDVRSLGNFPTSPELEKKMAQMTANFPEPKLQLDDGMQDLADLHAREDLLIGHYSWADPSKGKVRIPIDRAMELIAERGLPVAEKTETTPLLTGDTVPTVKAPLTTGFVYSGYEQEQASFIRKREKEKK